MIKRHVAIRPCLNNIAHNSKEADQLLANPILSILHFTFHSGVDVQSYRSWHLYYGKNP